MDKYINVDLAFKDIEESYCKPCKKIGKDNNGIGCRCCTFGDCIDIISQQPTADVIELDKVKQIIMDSMNDDNWHNGILIGLFRKICGEENHD